MNTHNYPPRKQVIAREEQVLEHWMAEKELIFEHTILSAANIFDFKLAIVATTCKDNLPLKSKNHLRI